MKWVGVPCGFANDGLLGVVKKNKAAQFGAQRTEPTFEANTKTEPTTEPKKLKKCEADFWLRKKFKLAPKSKLRTPSPGMRERSCPSS